MVADFLAHGLGDRLHEELGGAVDAGRRGDLMPGNRVHVEDLVTTLFEHRR